MQDQGLASGKKVMVSQPCCVVLELRGRQLLKFAEMILNLYFHHEVLE